MVARRERLRRPGILDDRMDPLAQEVGRGPGALRIAARVGPQLAKEGDEVARGQRLLETLATFGLAQLPAELRGPRQRHAGQRQAGLLAIGGAVFLQFDDAVCRLRAVVRRESVVRRALEDREM